MPQIETGNTVNDEVLISEDEEFGITLADLDTDQAVDLYIQIEDENGKLSDLKRMELDQDSRPAKKTDSAKKHKASKPKAEDSTVEGLDSPLEFYPDTFYDFKVIGAGTDNEDPENGDIKWVPVYWSTSANPNSNGSEAPGRSVPRKESTRRELLICMFSSANIPAGIPNGNLRIRYSLYSTSFSQPHFLKNNTVWSANISLT